MLTRLVLALCAAAGLAACTMDPAATLAGNTVIAPAPTGESSQLPNLGELKARLLEYYGSGTYRRDVAAVDDDATRWVLAHATTVARPALVLDIDETSLSSWSEMTANDFGFIPQGGCDALPAGPCGFAGWQARADAPALAPTLALACAAQEAHVAVFFITGRKADLAAVTAANLRHAGYHDWQGLMLEPVGRHYARVADFKAPARAAIEARGYTVVATVGDQVSDLTGGHALRGFKLPNPFYTLP